MSKELAKPIVYQIDDNEMGLKKSNAITKSIL